MMADQIKPEQKTLFPTRESLEEVLAEASAQLPITTHNQLVSLLHLQTNTVLNLAEQRL
jgi:hypothetical protein